jgi:hypothetical protein
MCAERFLSRITVDPVAVPAAAAAAVAGADHPIVTACQVPTSWKPLPDASPGA